MTNPVFVIIFFLSLTSVFSLVIAGFSRRLCLDTHHKQNRKNKECGESKLNEFMNGTNEEYFSGLNEFINDTLGKDSNYLAAVDEYLLETLDNLDSQENRRSGNRRRYVNIAAQLSFPSEGFFQAGSRNREVSAIGSKGIGFFNVIKEENNTESALDFFSGDSQYEFLMNLAHTGKAEDMERALETLMDTLLIDDREIIEILSAFPEGDEKKILFYRMIGGNNSHLASLFLKAANRQITEELINEILLAFHEGNKEIRAAAIKSFSTLGKDVPVTILINAMNDRDWEVRALAAKALGAVKTPEASSALFRALYDRQWWVRQNAAAALTMHPGYEPLFILAAESGDAYVRDSIYTVLENGVSPVLLRSIRTLVA